VPHRYLCPRCGAAIARKAWFCANCLQRICRACHQAVPEDASRCHRCGRPVPSLDAARGAGHAGHALHVAMAWIIGVMVATLLAGGIAGILLTR
jgi:predicted amidophosphoribosyltransferase